MRIDVAYICLGFCPGVGVYFFIFILIFDDLTMLAILHVVDGRVYRQWGACDESLILKPTSLVFQKCL
jgi:hypothetical protein